ncbi:hypothetical protein K504DRAFT_531845 [Pleomassaria siparia CBS 279.74]|uniref:Uncharacterized protein n=1 Tax=Pleomassaria siparia CBS 279.74 TaxID=1314801 RepID=A0A6G1KJ00_9PLEO|nr:hypothetical protein K504DRAFT_531845 [Pleomassaria siparia CBS 279.74]
MKDDYSPEMVELFETLARSSPAIRELIVNGLPSKTVRALLHCGVDSANGDKVLKATLATLFAPRGEDPDMKSHLYTLADSAAETREFWVDQANDEQLCALINHANRHVLNRDQRKTCLSSILTQMGTPGVHTPGVHKIRKASVASPPTHNLGDSGTSLNASFPRVRGASSQPRAKKAKPNQSKTTATLTALSQDWSANIETQDGTNEERTEFEEQNLRTYDSGSDHKKGIVVGEDLNVQSHSTRNFSIDTKMDVGNKRKRTSEGKKCKSVPGARGDTDPYDPHRVADRAKAFLKWKHSQDPSL